MLPIIVFLIPHPYQQITCYSFENLLMFGREMFFPFAGFAGTEGGRFAWINRRLKRIENRLAGSRQRNVGEEMIRDSIQSCGAVIDQIFKMKLHHFGMVEPTQVRSETIRDIWEFNVKFGSSKNAHLEARAQNREAKRNNHGEHVSLPFRSHRKRARRPHHADRGRESMERSEA